MEATVRERLKQAIPGTTESECKRSQENHSALEGCCQSAQILNRSQTVLERRLPRLAETRRRPRQELEVRVQTQDRQLCHPERFDGCSREPQGEAEGLARDEDQYDRERCEGYSGTSNGHGVAYAVRARGLNESSTLSESGSYSGLLPREVYSTWTGALAKRLSKVSEAY